MKRLKTNSQWRVWDNGTGYDLMLPEPQGVVDRFDEIASF